jgi:predicted RNA-binding protein with RPS1 domain
MRKKNDVTLPEEENEVMEGQMDVEEAIEMAIEKEEKPKSKTPAKRAPKKVVIPENDKNEEELDPEAEDDRTVVFVQETPGTDEDGQEIDYLSLDAEGEESVATPSPKKVKETTGKAEPDNKTPSRQRHPSIRSATGTKRVETVEDVEYLDDIEMMRSRRGAILTGTLSGVEVSKNFGVVGVILYGSYKVIIQADLFMVFPKFDPTRPYKDETDMKKKMLQKRIGAEVDFLVQHALKDERIAFASRLHAMQRKRKEGFGINKRTGTRIMRTGRNVEARVIATTVTSAIVEVSGIEFQIPLSELTWAYVNNADSVVAPGDLIEVILTKVEVENGKYIVEGSHKHTQNDPQVKAIQLYKKGGIYQGIASATTPSGVFVRLENGAQALAGLPRRTDQIPANGDAVKIVIKHVDTERKRLFCDILRVMGKR